MKTTYWYISVCLVLFIVVGAVFFALSNEEKPAVGIGSVWWENRIKQDRMRVASVSMTRIKGWFDYETRRIQQERIEDIMDWQPIEQWFQRCTSYTIKSIVHRHPDHPKIVGAIAIEELPDSYDSDVYPTDRVWLCRYRVSYQTEDGQYTQTRKKDIVAEVALYEDYGSKFTLLSEE
jgi:hypothetical protein